MNPPTPEELVARYGLTPHPEGGYYRETYRSALEISPVALPKEFSGPRTCATAVYFLLKEGEISRLHRLKSDELWHFYLGGPLELAQISPKGQVLTVVLGPDAAAGQTFQHAVPAGWWFGAAPQVGAGYSLVGCTVSPGFDFADFELGARVQLLRRFPAAQNVIERLAD